jgi:TonB-linked SusC/RagA family outer membrane protein
MTSRPEAGSHRTNSKTILLAMKLTAFFLLVLCLQVAATGHGQTVTLDLEKAPIEKVFTEVSKQTGFSFLYSQSLLKEFAPVTIRVKNAGLKEVLEKCFSGQPFGYDIEGKAIIIKKEPAPTSKENVHPAIPPPIDIHGRIVDENGSPVDGASVKVKGTDKGTSTNANGEFTLKAVDEDAILVITGVNIESFQVSVKGRSELALSAKMRDIAAEEVVIKGYYNTTGELNTGSVNTVNEKTIRRQPVGDPLLALQAQVPGLYIQQNTGFPGQLLSIELRGRNNFSSSGTDPLFIVDGVPFPTGYLEGTNYTIGVGRQSPLNTINPADIESITVLKDADATAIYGSRGANGVVLIKTKSGKEGKTTVDISFSKGIGKVTRFYDLLNTQQYLAMRREAFQNDGKPVPSITVTPADANYDINGTWDTTRYTDWQKVFIGGTSKITNGQVRLSGGSRQTNFYLSTTYRKESTVFSDDYYDEKGSFGVGLNHQSTNEKFKAGFTGNFVTVKNLMPQEDMTQFISLAPDAPSIYLPDGELNWHNDTWANPYAILTRKDRAVSSNLLGNLNLSYLLLPQLSISTSMGYNLIRHEHNIITPLSSYRPTLDRPQNRKNQMEQNEMTSWIIEPQVNFKERFSGFGIEALIGTTFQNLDRDVFAVSASNFASDQQIENLQSAAFISVDDNSFTRYRYSALFGRLSLDYQQKYVLNLTGRRDGSSRFGSGRQFGNFGAAGVAWIFSKERFMDKLPFISFGKIRSSYGITGNDQITDYQYLSTYTSNSYGYLNVNGLIPSRHVNPLVGWESVKKMEFGLELNFLNDRIKFVADWYRNRTSGQLLDYALPVYTGFDRVVANFPAIVQNTGLEFQISTINIDKNGFRWQTAFNFSQPKNKLVSFPGIETSTYATRYREGESLFGKYLYEYTGIDPQTGLFTFKDFNSDGKITSADDKKAWMEVGRNYFGGLTNTFSYRSWELSCLVQYVNQVVQSFKYYLQPGSVNQNQSVLVLERWQKPGDDGNWLQKYSTSTLSTRPLFESSTGIYEDGSFIRLKNVALSWSAPFSVTNRLHLQNLKINVQAQNLLTFSGYSGLDPESGSGLVLPPLRIIVAGIQVTF